MIILSDELTTFYVVLDLRVQLGTVLTQKMIQIVISSSYGDITRKRGNATHIT